MSYAVGVTPTPPGRVDGRAADGSIVTTPPQRDHPPKERESDPSGLRGTVFTGASLESGSHLVARLHRQLQVLETTVPRMLVPQLATPRCDIGVVVHASRSDPTEPGATRLITTVSHALAERMSREEWDPSAIAALLPELRAHVALAVAEEREGQLEDEQVYSWAAALVVSSRGLLIGEGRVSLLALTRDREIRRIACEDGSVEQLFDPQTLHAALLVVGPAVGTLPEQLLRSHLERDAPPDERLNGVVEALQASNVTEGGVIGAFFP